jgi:acetyl esterase/lipase
MGNAKDLKPQMDTDEHRSDQDELLELRRLMLVRSIAVFCLLVFSAALAFGQVTIPLWPEGKVPGQGAKEAELEMPDRDDGVRRITNVSTPTLTVYQAKEKSKAVPAMIVLPGGGYSYVTYNKEGTDIAEWLNANGYTALVLKYRVPNNRDGALMDLQRAISLTRAKAKDWGIDPSRLGVIGFSAGGHAAARASTRFAERAYKAWDVADKKNCRPDFVVLVYPAYLDDKNGKVNPDLDLKAKIPPTLIIHSEDDPTYVPGSKLYDAALTAAKVPHEFKLYQTGGHGYGLRGTKEAKVWPEYALEWLHRLWK